MKQFFKFVIFLSILWTGCKTDENKIVIPDLRPHFTALLNRRDSTLSLDSFYFVSMDTMTEKRALTHQRFSFLHIMQSIDDRLAWLANKRDSFHSVPSATDLETIEYLNGEKAYVGKEIDSFNILISTADSTAPVGYRAFYKVTVSKKDKFIVSDTLPYSISLKMKVSDWDRNIEKSIDSLAVGRQLHPGAIRP